MTRGSIVTVLASVAAILVACGGSDRSATPPSARMTKACEGLCDKAKECGGAVDVERCRSRCSSSAALRKIEAFKVEASDPMWACLTANVCERDHDALGKRCFHEVAQRLPVSPKLKSLCAKLEDAFASCEAPWATPCTEELRVFAEADLDGFSECLGRQCRSGVHCFRTAEHDLLDKPR